VGLSGRALFRWRVSLDRRVVHVLGAVVLLACVAFAILILPNTVSRARGNYLAFSDFFAQWSFGWYARSGAVSSIYDGDALHRFQLTLEPELRQFFPFPYPPTYLFAVLPLSFLPYGLAYLVWDGVTLALFLWAVFGTRLRTVMLWFVLFAPTTVISLQQGQNGLLTSALIVGGLRLMRERPETSGVLLGLATIKPQLGVLIPLALIAGGYWRTLVAAGLTAVALGLASGLAFGWDLWPAWLNAVAGHSGYVEQSVNNYLKPGIMANLALFHVSLPMAHGIQVCVSLVVAGMVVWCFRAGASDLSLAVLQVGTFVAMPFVFRYDMPMLANAILLLARDWRRSGRTGGPVEAGIVVLGLLAPALTTLTTRFFYVSGVSLVLLFGLIVWRWSERTRAE
jgi:Glycosyltransferase family 87